jgi:hypothetical protein
MGRVEIDGGALDHRRQAARQGTGQSRLKSSARRIRMFDFPRSANGRGGGTIRCFWDGPALAASVYEAIVNHHRRNETTDTLPAIGLLTGTAGRRAGRLWVANSCTSCKQS